jgi:hypothetical protein
VNRYSDILRRCFHAAIIAGVLLFATAIYPEALPSEHIPEEELKKDLGSVKSNGFLVIPHMYYKPETQLAGGLVFITYFRPEADEEKDGEKKKLPLDIRPSTVATTLTYTQRNQFIWELFPELYMANEKYHVVGLMEAMRYPNKFWGIGNDTPDDFEEDYTSDIFRARVDVQRETLRKVYVGLVFQYDWYDMTKTEEGGLLDDGDITGSGKGTASGLGLPFNHDTRNHPYLPSRGGQRQATVIAFHRLFSTTYRFMKYVVDLKQFFPLWKTHVFALQGYLSVISGEAPFEMLSKMGGKNLMRGYFEGRYRDNNMMILQGEYRVPVFWRIGATAFAGMGQVAEEMSDVQIEEFKYTYGGGLRFNINPQEKVNARLDVGRSPGFTAVYVSIGEAY